MRSGMLWFDDDNSRSVEEKVLRAARHYEKKYGSEPTLCYVHPSMVNGAGVNANGVEVRTANTVLPHHFWLGHEETKKRRRTAA